jgi:hypothetical protein
LAVNDVELDKPTKKSSSAPSKRKSKHEANSGGKTTFTIDSSVLVAFKETTEYGLSFRSMTSDGQKSEVVRLNKGAATKAQRLA